MCFLLHKSLYFFQITYTSDYFQDLYDLAVELIRRGHAYVDHQVFNRDIEVSMCREMKILSIKLHIVPSPTSGKCCFFDNYLIYLNHHFLYLVVRISDTGIFNSLMLSSCGFIMLFLSNLWVSISVDKRTVNLSDTATVTSYSLFISIV